MLNNGAEILTDYVLERLEDEPVEKRPLLYRALASLAAPEDSRKFLALASDCEAILTKHHQLLLDFRRRSGRR